MSLFSDLESIVTNGNTGPQTRQSTATSYAFGRYVDGLFSHAVVMF